MADGRAPQPAASFSPSAPEDAGSLNSTGHNLKIPATDANMDGLSARPLIPPVPHEAMGSTTASLQADSDTTTGLLLRHPPCGPSTSSLPWPHMMLWEAQTASDLHATRTTTRWTCHCPHGRHLQVSPGHRQGHGQHNRRPEC